MPVISSRELQHREMITGVTLAIISTPGYRCRRRAIYSPLITTMLFVLFWIVESGFYADEICLGIDMVVSIRDQLFYYSTYVRTLLAVTRNFFPIQRC